MRLFWIAAALVAGAGGAEAGAVDNLLQSCDFAADRSYCLVQQDQFREEWPKANRGDYPSQRNVAFCLLHGCDGAVAVDGVAACAWRTVIIASDAAWDSGDMERYRVDCGGVREKGAAMARVLYRRIYNRPMPSID